MTEVEQVGVIPKEEFETKTHEYEAKCDLNLHITTRKDNGKIISIRAGKGGTCRSIMWEVMAKLLNEVKPEKVVAIMEHYSCEHGGLGGQSCFDKLARMYRASLREGGK